MPTLAAYNTIALTLNVAQKLVSATAGNHTYYIINLGPGNLYIRADQAPTGTSDALAMKIPVAASILQFYVNNGSSGIWVMADATGSISVADRPVR